VFDFASSTFLFTRTDALALIGWSVLCVHQFSGGQRIGYRNPPSSTIGRNSHVSERTDGIAQARANHPNYRHGAQPWHIPYNSRCLIKGCDTKVYHDGQTYFSLCLQHLEELELGPFYKSNRRELPYDNNAYD
jgi:hypothetical protein